ncbi:NifU family protein [Meiothermus cerbereus]|uniref:NifU family protein n=1 Tax=Meiothermus cerbereus TaxID=65552 RepID=UPI003EEBA2DA
MSTEVSLDELVAELNARIQNLEALPFPQVREEVFAVLQITDYIHRAGVERLGERLTKAGLLEEVLQDPAVNLLFTLYNQNPHDQASLAEQALELVRPYMQSHGGEVEVLAVEDGVVHVRLQGSCKTCAASAATLKNGIEVALRNGLPEFKGLVVHEPEPDEPIPGLIELPMAGMGAPIPTTVHAPVFTQVAEFSGLSQTHVTPVLAGDKEVILVRLGAEVYAFDCTCPGCKMPLNEAKLSSNVIVCTWQNCAYDARNGQRVDGVEGASLRIYPVSVQGNRVLLATDLQARELFSR